MIVLCVVFHLLWFLVEVQPQPQPTVTISRSRNGPVYAGTEFVLSTTISLNLSGFDMDFISSLLLDIRWGRGNDHHIVNDTRTTVSPVSGSGMTYTASLTYSPIAISDSGQVNATVTVSSSTEPGTSPATAFDTKMLTVKGT